MLVSDLMHMILGTSRVNFEVSINSSHKSSSPEEEEEEDTCTSEQLATHQIR